MMSVKEVVGKVLADQHADVLRQAVAWPTQELMEAEVSRVAGAREANAIPTGWRAATATASRPGTTRVGRIDLAIPRLRSGSYVPSFLEPRRRSKQTLVAVVQQATVTGISTCKVERLVEALGWPGVQGSGVTALPRPGWASRHVGKLGDSTGGSHGPPLRPAGADTHRR
jgi:putative transposase